MGCKRDYFKLAGLVLCLSLLLLSCSRKEEPVSQGGSLTENTKKDSTAIDSNTTENKIENNTEENNTAESNSTESDAAAGNQKESKPESEKAGNTVDYYRQYQESKELPVLAQVLEGSFKAGVALSAEDIKNPLKAKLVASQFNSITCENEMKADFTLDREATLKRGEEKYPVVNMQRAETALNFAKENGLTMRAHTLVWHSQTPRWLFTVGFEDSEKAPLVSREIMLARMENYIKQEMEYVNTHFPGVVYAWDVVNEAIETGDGQENGIRTKNNLWYEVLGEDYVEMAFTYARKYMAEGQKLFYNDYSTYDKTKMFAVYKLLEKLKEKNLVDGIGMQDHIQLSNPNVLDYQYAINKYAELGIELQVTELDIDMKENSEEAQEKLGTRYKNIMAVLLHSVEKGKANITSVTFWGLTDDRSWLNNAEGASYPLLFDKELNPKKAYFGVLQDSSIKNY
ncbi:endo-1,4-beta-xylanase [Anaerocolumna sp. AGMB13020]|uniref:endo-1,4-beta-xylanase n=1 Tax=Anaerocolumna sp. AGMB13020 TaxID=3081750 RepID=UPI0029530062|nr:endo-1,4-beta-xylanase [Anaerocolumna sp. AGMB13020]WOO38278.1 endo-1,4-beta-xylanase [Anaerocolumna sp. AGMB13020]